VSAGWGEEPKGGKKTDEVQGAQEIERKGSLQTSKYSSKVALKSRKKKKLGENQHGIRKKKKKKKNSYDK